MSRNDRGARGSIRARGAIALAIAGTMMGCSSEATTPPIDEPLVGEHVFVGGASDGLMHVFEAATLEEVATVEVGAGASEVHSTPDGRTVWALATDAAQVALIDAETLEVRIVPVGLRPVHSYLEPGGRRIWVGNDGSGDVSIIDLETGAETRTLTGNGHHKMAFVTDHAGALAFVYVSNITDGTLTVLDPDGDVVEQVTVGPAPHGIAYSHATMRVYNCSGDEQNSIEVLDPFGEDPHAVVERIALPAGRCGWIHTDGHGEEGWMGMSSAGLIGRITFATSTVETWSGGTTPDKAAVVGDRAFVANVTEPTVTVVELASGETRTIEIGNAHLVDGRGHRGIRYHAGRVYVPNEHDGTVSVIDTETETVIATLAGIPGAKGIAVANGGTGTPPE